jgi:hypothetical protein
MVALGVNNCSNGAAQNEKPGSAFAPLVETHASVRPLPLSRSMRINRKCPICSRGMGLARRAVIGPSNRLRILLACQSCLHEWEVEEEPPIVPPPAERKD